MSGTKKCDNTTRCFKMLNKVLLLLIIATGVYYVTVVNELTVKGFKLQQLKQEKQVLKRENDQLNLKVTSLRSYENLSEKAKELDMVAIRDVDYVKSMDGMMAKK